MLDEHLPRDALAHASDVESLAAVVLDIPSGRVALWRMDGRFENVYLECVLGEGVQTIWIHDNRLGRALDHIDEVGTDTLLSDDQMQEISHSVVGVAKWLIRAEQRRLDAEAASARDPEFAGAPAREDGK